MPPKGWKKNAQPAPAKTGPGEKIMKKLDERVGKTLRRGAEKLAAVPLTASGGEQTGSSQEIKSAASSVAQVISVLVSAKAGLTGSATQKVSEAIDTGLVGALEHLDRLRKTLPLGQPEGIETGNVKAAQASEEPAQATQEAAPVATPPAPPLAAPAQAPAPYGAPPPQPARA